MNFYEDWKRVGLDNQNFIAAFLAKQNESITPFVSGTLEEQKMIFDIISQVKFDELFEFMINKKYDQSVLPADVPQFSSFEDGVVRVPELLEFAPEGLPFYELGYQMVKANKVGACVKYGENQSKLAKLAELVTIDRVSSACVVNSTSWGKYLVAVPFDDKDDVIRKVLVRDYLLQKIIVSAYAGPINYRDMVGCLSYSTATRRRSNVKYLVEYILQGTGKEAINNNITW